MERSDHRQALQHQSGPLIDLVREQSDPLRDRDDLDPLIEGIGDSRVVMLGEATHGTSEFYTWRAKLSQRLIEEEGFSFIAVEGDWPDCYRLNRLIKSYEGAEEEALDVARRFERWPTWMWANWEVVAILDRLREFNNTREGDDKIGFYGLDVYSLRESLNAILDYLQDEAPDSLEAAREAMNCFEPHRWRGQDYARAVAMVGADCRDEVVDLLTEMRRRKESFDGDGEEEFSARQNAQVLVNAERYYRTMIRGGPESWNIRDRHMAKTLDELLEFHGPDSKAIVWEHNTHIGDARFTPMAARNTINIGQLAREQYGEDDVVLVGFGSHRGTVMAGSSWGASMEEMTLPAAVEGSWEDIFFRAHGEDCLLLMEALEDQPVALERRGHRAVGVVYHPGREHLGNYVPTVLPRRYDAFVYIDRSQALHPLHIQPRTDLEPETYPWGV